MLFYFLLCFNEYSNVYAASAVPQHGITRCPFNLLQSGRLEDVDVCFITQKKERGIFMCRVKHVQHDIEV